MRPFHLFGPDHLVAVLVIVGACAAALRFGSRLPPAVRRGGSFGLCAVLLCYAGATYLHLAQIGRPWHSILPLHLCDLLVVLCVAALLGRNRFATELAWYWGCTGTFPAILTPDLHAGFPEWAFLHFFWGHGALLLSIAWAVGAEDLRPSPGSSRRAFVWLVVYAAVVGVLDALFGWNYGYLCRPPAGATVVSLFGPWPWYIVTVVLIAGVAFFLLELPWRRPVEPPAPPP